MRWERFKLGSFHHVGTLTAFSVFAPQISFKTARREALEFEKRCAHACRRQLRRMQLIVRPHRRWQAPLCGNYGLAWVGASHSLVWDCLWICARDTVQYQLFLNASTRILAVDTVSSLNNQDDIWRRAALLDRCALACFGTLRWENPSLQSVQQSDS